MNVEDVQKNLENHEADDLHWKKKVGELGLSVGSLAEAQGQMTKEMKEVKLIINGWMETQKSIGFLGRFVLKVATYAGAGGAILLLINQIKQLFGIR